ncbi:divalent-cation tolerance protein CutA [Pseudolysobacter antarcticus]|uniref:divalent-cation tolerance protein CutA n=1 Tax=Pseudolysobacter antarcticus TaxID=2511995 RepID=UPI001F5C4B34|nr:divalent-cation tolerance protein CutA [Pseudolysobacter antarcticus]
MILLILTTCPNQESAEHISHTLVSEGLAACVNRITGVQSTYRWHGKVQTDSEILLLIKTTQGHYAEVQARIVALHPYELPEVIAVEAAAGLDRYLAWIENETRLD